jgi:hypothetical protein
MAFLDDEYKASQAVGVSVQNTVLPVVSGTSYTDLIPLAMANVLVRIKTINDFGVVSFRCSEVFNRPRLPLLRLQDLGVDAVEVTNIKGVDFSDDTDTSFHGIPIGNDIYLNIINLSIGFGTYHSNAQNKAKEIVKVIKGSLDYTDLPDLSDELVDQGEITNLVYDRLLDEIQLYHDTYNLDYIESGLETIKVFMAEAHLWTIYNQGLYNDTKNDLSIINDGTDWTEFDYSITDTVAENLNVPVRYDEPTNFIHMGKLYTSMCGIPPKDELSEIVYINSTEISIGFYINLVSEAINIVKTCYQSSDIDRQLYQIERLNSQDMKLKTQRDFIINQTRDGLTEQKYLDLINTLETLFNTFHIDHLPTDLDTTMENRVAVLDTFFSTIGNPSSILIHQLTTIRSEDNTTTDDRLSETYLGNSFKDSGNFFYADLAYAVGYGKMTELHSIQIDDELYHLTGETAVSESGCIKYKFTRHVLPTYDVEVELYIYPGTPDQPYCPTVNRYHNFATSKYSGMFSKLTAEGRMGLYTFKGYRPMQQTVEAITELGTVDLNAINLNDPSLDKGSYEAMLQKEVKNLTNASSILSDGTITTEDFKYYLASHLVDEDSCNNYPGLIIVEFKHFPIGASFKFPKIKILATAEDPIRD